MKPVAAGGFAVAVSALLLACGGQSPEPISATAFSPAAPRFAVEINRPDGPPRVDTGTTDAHGQPVSVACSTCHTTRQPNMDLRSGEELALFHQGLHFNHGALTCVSCHNPRDYDALRLADGRSLAYPEVMQLCAQCHGTQYRDYERGAHGGMTGFWDLSRGPRQRNNCIDCHDPHYPAFQGMVPVAGPRDRFLTPKYESETGEDTHHE